MGTVMFLSINRCRSIRGLFGGRNTNYRPKSLFPHKIQHRIFAKPDRCSGYCRSWTIFFFFFDNMFFFFIEAIDGDSVTGYGKYTRTFKPKRFGGGSLGKGSGGSGVGGRGGGCRGGAGRDSLDGGAGGGGGGGWGGGGGRGGRGNF
jgi:hypothetical protein